MDLELKPFHLEVDCISNKDLEMNALQLEVDCTSKQINTTSLDLEPDLVQLEVVKALDLPLL
ncbi:hypothetical protein PGTUg99_000612 [Puccinia graminis f. sp. tritici]|uniref:Uncharacterized protein n=1 Tax=Puccinia graminis f. sp. tritici TaxID=56615 RepID=A0A5B0RCP7_PUCGR|nr:hypothetical protein PGTUg99_000612 [Puccinia graminis f. sp. tritici]